MDSDSHWQELGGLQLFGLDEEDRLMWGVVGGACVTQQGNFLVVFIQ